MWTDYPYQNERQLIHLRWSWNNEFSVPAAIGIKYNPDKVKVPLWWFPNDEDVGYLKYFTRCHQGCYVDNPHLGWYVNGKSFYDQGGIRVTLSLIVPSQFPIDGQKYGIIHKFDNQNRMIRIWKLSRKRTNIPALVNQLFYAVRSMSYTITFRLVRCIMKYR